MPRRRAPARLYYRRDEQQWVIRDGNRQKRTGYGYGQLAEAEKAFGEYLSQQEPPSRNGPANPGDLTVGEVLARYVADKGPTMASQDTLIYSTRALIPFWGDLTCDAVKGSTCRRYAKQRDVAPATARRELGVLQAALSNAHAEGLLVHPIKVTLPPNGEPTDRWLTRSEAAALLWHAAPHVRRFILVSLYTGRRMSAVLDLTWLQVDLDAGVIRFAREAETKKRRGRARISRQLRAAMSCWQDGQPHVVHYRGGRVDGIKTGIKRAAERAGLEGVSPHVLKHTAITWGVMKGMDLEDAAEFFDTSPETIRKHYWHHSPQHQRRAVEIMERK